MMKTHERATMKEGRKGKESEQMSSTSCVRAPDLTKQNGLKANGFIGRQVLER